MLLLTFATALTADSFSGQYLLSYPETALKAAEAPLNWKDSDWIKAGGFLFMGGVFYLFDEEIAAVIEHNRTPLTHELADIGNDFGDGKYVLPVMGLTFASGYLLHSPKTEDTALLCLKSFLLADGLTTSLKFLTQRQRPVKNNGKQFWNGNGFSIYRDSFPSGHTTVVWSVAPIVAAQYKDSKWVPPLVYSMAALTSYSRMHDERHWASDVFTGAVIGYFTSKLVLKNTPRMYVTPSDKVNGVQINLLF